MDDAHLLTASTLRRALEPVYASRYFSSKFGRKLRKLKRQWVEFGIDDQQRCCVRYYRHRDDGDPVGAYVFVGRAVTVSKLPFQKLPVKSEKLGLVVSGVDVRQLEAGGVSGTGTRTFHVYAKNMRVLTALKHAICALRDTATSTGVCRIPNMQPSLAAVSERTFKRSSSFQSDASSVLDFDDNASQASRRSERQSFGRRSGLFTIPSGGSVTEEFRRDEYTSATSDRASRSSSLGDSFSHHHSRPGMEHASDFSRDEARRRSTSQASAASSQRESARDLAAMKQSHAQPSAATSRLSAATSRLSSITSQSFSTPTKTPRPVAPQRSEPALVTTRTIMQCCGFLSSSPNPIPRDLFDNLGKLKSSISKLSAKFAHEVQPSLDGVNPKLVAGALIVAFANMDQPMFHGGALQQLQAGIGEQQATSGDGHRVRGRAVQDMVNDLPDSYKRLLREWSHTMSVLHVKWECVTLERSIQLFAPHFFRGALKATKKKGGDLYTRLDLSKYPEQVSGMKVLFLALLSPLERDGLFRGLGVAAAGTVKPQPQKKSVSFASETAVTTDTDEEDGFSMFVGPHESTFSTTANINNVERRPSNAVHGVGGPSGAVENWASKQAAEPTMDRRDDKLTRENTARRLQPLGASQQEAKSPPDTHATMATIDAPESRKPTATADTKPTERAENLDFDYTKWRDEVWQLNTSMTEKFNTDVVKQAERELVSDNGNRRGGVGNREAAAVGVANVDDDVQKRDGVPRNGSRGSVGDGSSELGRVANEKGRQESNTVGQRASGGVGKGVSGGVGRRTSNGVDQTPSNGVGQTPSNGVGQTPRNGVRDKGVEESASNAVGVRKSSDVWSNNQINPNETVQQIQATPTTIPRDPSDEWDTPSRSLQDAENQDDGPHFPEHSFYVESYKSDELAERIQHLATLEKLYQNRLAEDQELAARGLGSGDHSAIEHEIEAVQKELSYLEILEAREPAPTEALGLLHRSARQDVHQVPTVRSRENSVASGRDVLDLWEASKQHSPESLMRTGAGIHDPLEAITESTSSMERHAEELASMKARLGKSGEASELVLGLMDVLAENLQLKMRVNDFSENLIAQTQAKLQQFNDSFHNQNASGEEKSVAAADVSLASCIQGRTKKHRR